MGRLKNKVQKLVLMKRQKRNNSLVTIAHLLMLATFCIACKCVNKFDEAASTNRTEQEKSEDSVFLPAEMNSELFSTAGLVTNSISTDTVTFQTEYETVSKNGKAYMFVQTKYNADVFIESGRFDTSEEDTLSFPRDWLSIGGRRFVLDSLYYGKKLTGKSEPIRSQLQRILRIDTQNGNRYLSVFVKNLFYGNSSNWDELLFLFDITNLKAIRAMSVGYTKCTGIKAFGSYLGSGELDFLYLGSESHEYDTLRMYKVGVDRPELVVDKYIVLRALEGTGRAYSIEFQRSSWWNLKKRS